MKVRGTAARLVNSAICVASVGRMRGPGDEGDEGRGAQVDAEASSRSRRRVRYVRRRRCCRSVQRRQPGEAENRYQLHDAEQP